MIIPEKIFNAACEEIDNEGIILHTHKEIGPYTQVSPSRNELHTRLKEASRDVQVLMYTNSVDKDFYYYFIDYEKIVEDYPETYSRDEILLEAIRTKLGLKEGEVHLNYEVKYLV